MFGRLQEDGTVRLFEETGEVVTKLDPGLKLVWPVNSNRSAYYETPGGLVLSREDAEKLGIHIEIPSALSNNTSEEGGSDA